MNERRDKFIRYLLKLEADEERATLATLRRGLGEPPGTVLALGRYVYPFFGSEELETPYGRRESEAFFLIATLFALHPQNVSSGNMGAHLRELKREKEQKGEKDDATERRFAQLLATHPNDLHEVLPRILSLLKAKDEKINWRQLLDEVYDWRFEKPQKAWARSFWHKAARITDLETESNPTTPEGE